MATVYLSLGSNIDRAHNIRSGLEQLEREFGGLRLSPVYESEAVGFDGSPFFNLVVGIETDLPVVELAGRLRDIERAHGRVRGEKKFASRTLDIDILTYDRLIGDIGGVQLPRDEILKHAFVLRPLADLAPDERHPVLDKSYRDLLADTYFPGQALWAVPFDWPGRT